MIILTSSIDASTLLWIGGDLLSLLVLLASIFFYVQCKKEYEDKKNKKDLHSFVPLIALGFGSSVYGPVAMGILLATSLVFIIMGINAKNKAKAIAPVVAPVAAPVVEETPVKIEEAPVVAEAAPSVVETATEVKETTPIIEETAPAVEETVAPVVAPIVEEAPAKAKTKPAKRKKRKAKPVKRVPKLKEVPYPKGKEYPVNLENIEKSYSKGEVVNVESLKEKGLVPGDARRVKCLGHLPLRIELVFDLPDYSGDAYRTILSSGSTILRKRFIHVHG